MDSNHDKSQPARIQFKRVGIALVAGAVLFVAIIWMLTIALGEHPIRYQGKTGYEWADQLNSSNSTPAARNEAQDILTSQIIPRLTQIILADTNESPRHQNLVNALNELPGINIDHKSAFGRRAQAMGLLGKFGPPAKPALPLLLQLAQTTNELRCIAIKALGEIHCEPDKVIPLLISFLDSDELDVNAATALGHYGPLAKAAVPKLVKMLHGRDDDDISAAMYALGEIDPSALTNNAP